jgi:hypothetical protein
MGMKERHGRWTFESSTFLPRFMRNQIYKLSRIASKINILISNSQNRTHNKHLHLHSSLNKPTVIMPSFNLTVSIDKAILNTQSSDKLVIARKVNGSLNTVFDGYSIAASSDWKKLLSTTEFKWTENFKVFLVSSVSPGDPVSGPRAFAIKAAKYGDLPMCRSLPAPTRLRSHPTISPPMTRISSRTPRIRQLVLLQSLDLLVSPKFLRNCMLLLRCRLLAGLGQHRYVDRDSHVGKTKITLQPQNEVSTGFLIISQSSQMLILSIVPSHVEERGLYRDHLGSR